MRRKSKWLAYLFIWKYLDDYVTDLGTCSFRDCNLSIHLISFEKNIRKTRVESL